LTLQRLAGSLLRYFDGFAKSPSADGQNGLSANAGTPAPIIASQLYVIAAYFYVRLIPQLSQALHLKLFALPLRS
jgi:hypothetical protein